MLGELTLACTLSSCLQLHSLDFPLAFLFWRGHFRVRDLQNPWGRRSLVTPSLYLLCLEHRRHLINIFSKLVSSLLPELIKHVPISEPLLKPCLLPGMHSLLLSIYANTDYPQDQNQALWDRSCYWNCYLKNILTDYIKLTEGFNIHTFILNIMQSDLIMVNTDRRGKTNVISEIHRAHSGMHIFWHGLWKIYL